MIGAAEQQKSAATVPAAWIAYAAKVRQKIEAVFGGNDDVAQRFHGDMERLYFAR